MPAVNFEGTATAFDPEPIRPPPQATGMETTPTMPINRIFLTLYPLRNSGLSGHTPAPEQVPGIYTPRENQVGGVRKRPEILTYWADASRDSQIGKFICYMRCTGEYVKGKQVVAARTNRYGATRNAQK